jgi:hypothetical protein
VLPKRDALMKKLTKNEMDSLLKEMLEKLKLLTEEFLLDKENKKEWESTTVTLERQKDFEKELLMIQDKPEFSEYKLQNSTLVQAICTDLEALERFIIEHETNTQSSRAQKRKAIYLQGNKYLLEHNSIREIISNYLVKVCDHTTHTISDTEMNEITTRVQTFLKAAHKQNLESQARSFLANLQVIKNHRDSQLVVENQRTTIAAMRGMLEKYVNLLKLFQIKSKKQSSKEIGAELFRTLEFVAEELKIVDPGTNIKDLHRADEAITKALSQRETQQSKSKSRNIFVSTDKVTLEKILSEIKKDQPEWQKLLNKVDEPKTKVIKTKP